jgi:hypothetical protein
MHSCPRDMQLDELDKRWAQSVWLQATNIDSIVQSDNDYKCNPIESKMGSQQTTANTYNAMPRLPNPADLLLATLQCACLYSASVVVGSTSISSVRAAECSLR